MTEHQKMQLLDAVMHYLPLNVRRQVAAEVPEAYMAWCAVQNRMNEMATDEHTRIRALLDKER